MDTEVFQNFQHVTLSTELYFLATIYHEIILSNKIISFE